MDYCELKTVDCFTVDTEKLFIIFLITGEDSGLLPEEST